MALSIDRQKKPTTFEFTKSPVLSWSSFWAGLLYMHTQTGIGLRILSEKCPLRIACTIADYRRVTTVRSLETVTLHVFIN